MRPAVILETILYADDVAAMRAFYEGVIGLTCTMETQGRQAFFRCGSQMLLIFNPAVTSVQVPSRSVPPPHGTRGLGHVCFAANSQELDQWRKKLGASNIKIEAEIDWKGRGRSIYFRDPAGNSVEFAEPRIWPLRGGRLVVASHNQGKAREMAELLEPYEVDVLSAADLGLAEPEETGESFAANAELKARAAAKATGLPALADDSGLCVAALDGAPGIYSARWAGPHKDFAMAMRNVEEKLQAKGAADRKAHFISALSIGWPDGHSETFEGRVDGRLVWPPRGAKGFGYDPMFLPDDCDMTFGEMEPSRKHDMSHRARAFRKLADAVF